MQPRFTRAEYWILELVVGGSWPLCYLSATNIEEIFNKPGHGLERAVLIDTLVGLFEAKLIEAGIDPGDTPAGPLARVGIEAALSEPGPFGGLPYTYYRLTPEGGSQWEAFANPNWDRYVVEVGDLDAGRGELICSNREWLEEYFGYYSASDSLVDPDSAHYRGVRPWQATYWKRLPEATAVSFNYEEVEAGQVRRRRSLPDWFTVDGFHALRDGWYRWR